MIAAKSPKRIKISSARLSSLSPGRWAAISGGTVLLLGLIWISLSASRNGRSGRYERNYGAQVPVPVRSLSIQPADQQGFTANPTPTRAVNPPTYAPMTAPAQPASNYYARQSAPPPINPYDADPDRKIASRLATGIRESVSSDSNSALLPLPPAQPDLSGAPELKDPNARLAKRADLAAAPSDPTPWLKKAAPKKPPETGASLLSGKLVGRASVGVDPGTRKNLPAPSDAVTSSSSVRQSPPTVVRSDSPDASDAQRNRPTGRQLQAEARRYQYQGKWAEAKQAYQAAIDAYQDEINNGRNPKQAEYGMAASQAALDLLDSSR